MSIKYIKGDLFELMPIDKAAHRHIIHVVNNRGGWGKGFVVALSKHYRPAEMQYRARMEIQGASLGDIQQVYFEDRNVSVINMFAQDGYKSKENPKPLQYWALARCLQEVRLITHGSNIEIHAPKFGAGLAGGDWRVIEALLYEALGHLPVSIYTL